MLQSSSSLAWNAHLMGFRHSGLNAGVFFVYHLSVILNRPFLSEKKKKQKKQAYIAHFLGQLIITGVTCLSEILFYQWHLKCENSCSVVIRVIHVADCGVEQCSSVCGHARIELEDIALESELEWVDRNSWRMAGKGSEIFLGILGTDNKIGGFSFPWNSETVLLLSIWPAIRYFWHWNSLKIWVSKNEER